MFSNNILHLDSVEKFQSFLTLSKKQREREEGEWQWESWKFLVHSEVEETYFSNVFFQIQIPITDALSSQAPSICNSVSF